MDIQQFQRLPVMGILRGVRKDILSSLTETVIRAGLKTVEITMNTPSAGDLIRSMTDISGGRLAVGAGTVLSVDSLEAACDAGATFIVCPTMIEDVVACCVSRRIPVFPGALTPQEIYRAWQAGATMVKVFPAKFFGPAYFKEIRGPFSDIKLLACGGVTPDNIQTYFKNGAAAVAFGGSIFRQEWLTESGLSSIEQEIRRLVQAGSLPSEGQKAKADE